MDRMIRKYQNALVISGRGVVLFGLWNIARLFISYFFAGDMLIRMLKDGIDDTSALDSIDDSVLKLSILIMIFVVFFVDLLIRIYVGKRAIARGKGQKSNNAYVVIAFILFAISLYGDLSGLMNISGHTEKADYIISTIVDLTSVYAWGDVVYSSIRLRILENKLSSGKVAENAG